MLQTITERPAWARTVKRQIKDTCAKAALT